MKIENITAPLIGYNGEPLTNGDDKELTLRAVACQALTATYPKESLSGEDKVARFELASRLYQQPEPHLTVEETALLKRLIGTGFGPMVVGPAWALLDPKEPPPP